MSSKPKVLCLCEGGNVRSVNLAFQLKHEHDYDAIAAGVLFTQDDTLEMLCNWADFIIVMTERLRGFIPSEFADKIRVCEVGDDVWGFVIHFTLHNKVKAWIQQNKATI